jgi:hypothetical protein
VTVQYRPLVAGFIFGLLIVALVIWRAGLSPYFGGL